MKKVAAPQTDSVTPMGNLPDGGHSSLDRKRFLQLGALGLGASLLPLGWSCTRPQDYTLPLPNGKQPNILWISVEDISPRLGSYGDNLAKTPNIDKLAAEGMRFTNAFTSAPVCAPVRSGIITGMYQTSIGTHHMRTSHKAEGLPTPYEAVPPPYVKTFTEYLRASGYYCSNNFKTDYQFGTPVTSWDESSRTAHYRNRPDKDQPFFAVINLTETHESHNWEDAELTDPALVEVPSYFPDTPKVRNSIARLYDSMEITDREVGRILQELDDDGLADDTIVFFWTDHGDGLPRGKRWLYDSGTHIPLIIRWPEHIKPGSVNSDLISSIDLGPTAMAMAGVTIPTHLQGQPALGSSKETKRKYVFSARDRFDHSYDMVRSVRDKTFLYIRNFYPYSPYVLWVPYRNRGPVMQELLKAQAEGTLTEEQAIWLKNSRPPEELFDVKKDPENLNNLAEDPKYEAVLHRMAAALDDWQEETDDMGSISEEQMVAAWYPGGVQPSTAVPKFIPNSPTNRGLTAIEGNVSLAGPAMIKLYCVTQGASIAYTMDSGDDSRWLLYNGPIRLPVGETHIRAKAIRYGYKESAEATVSLAVSDQ